MKKCKILPAEFLCFFRYHYSRDTVLFFEPKTKKKPSFEEGETYWVAEEYRLVDDLIQYKNDIYRAESPKWIEASKMKADFSRYHLECVKATSEKLQNIDKKRALQFGVAPKTLTWYFNEEKPKSFKKPEEVWRLKQYWESLYPNFLWENNPEIYVFEFNLRKVKAKYPNYLDKHWYEKLK